MDSLYLGMMIEALGFPGRVKQIARHKKMSVSVAMVEKCRDDASLVSWNRWKEIRLTTLRDIMCHCCLSHPEFAWSLKTDVQLQTTERNRDNLDSLTPTTYEYVQLCRALRPVTLTGSVPVPVWRVTPTRVMSQHRYFPDPVGF